MRMRCTILFVVYKEDHNMLRLQPKLKRHMGVLSPYLVTVGQLVLNKQTVGLPAKGSNPVLQPLPQPQLRHSKSLQVAPEAQPVAVLLVNVLIATNVAAINAPHDQKQEEGTSDVQQMQQNVCGLRFEVTLNNAHTGDKMDLRLPYMYVFIL